jgi:fumarate reductase flavoprotein subunit
MAAGTMMKILTEKAKEMGVKIILQTAVKKILKQGDRITGALVEDRSEEPVEVETKAVVVATRGVGDNPEMIKKYTGFQRGKDLFSFIVPGMTGDGIRMAWEVGSAPTEITIGMTYGMPGECDPMLPTHFANPT